MDGSAQSWQTAVAVIDDDEAICDWMQRTLGVRGLRTRTYRSAEAFLGDPAGMAGCLLLDLQLPGLSGLDLLKRLQQQPSAPAVVIITAHGDVQSARAALKMGALDFIEKPVRMEELLAAIDEALSFEQKRRERRVARAQAEARVARLTERERQVFFAVTEGLSHQETGERLGISPRTVEVHRARMMDRLGLKRVADAFRLRFALDA